MPPESPPLLSVRRLCKYFPVYSGGFLNRQTGQIKAVDDVSFDLFPKQTLGLVGESGSGKTTTARTILHALEPTRGEIVFRHNGQIYDLTTLDKATFKSLRPHMQLIFQDPFASLNPRMTVRDLVGEPLLINKLAKGKAINDRVIEILKKVGLKAEHLYRYPHAFSGGQRQRIAIARALIMKPSLVLADEPVSALDVSVQAQVINLLEDLQDEFELTYLFVAHDLSVVRHICDRVAVMYAGKIVELADTADLFKAPKHPYTRMLLAAVPDPDPDAAMDFDFEGASLDLSKPPSGCSFATRCPLVIDRCRTEEPQLRACGKNRQASCHVAE